MCVLNTNMIILTHVQLIVDAANKTNGENTHQPWRKVNWKRDGEDVLTVKEDSGNTPCFRHILATVCIWIEEETREEKQIWVLRKNFHDRYLSNNVVFPLAMVMAPEGGGPKNISSYLKFWAVSFLQQGQWRRRWFEVSLAKLKSFLPHQLVGSESYF